MRFLKYTFIREYSRRIEIHVNREIVFSFQNKLGLMKVWTEAAKDWGHTARSQRQMAGVRGEGVES